MNREMMLMVVQCCLLAAGLLFAFMSVGTSNREIGDRCGTLAILFVVSLVVVLIAELI